MSKFNVVWLTGDYTGQKKERQMQAQKNKCDVVIEFHFNASLNGSAKGAEVWYRIYSIVSRRLAEILLAKFTSIGLKPRGVRAATKDSRAAFINSYPNNIIVVLLEPAFVTNKEDATKLHDKKFMNDLASAIANGLRDFAAETKHREIKTIGLSVGHIGKSSNPKDKGAKCVFGDYEADHAKEVAEIVAKLLQS